MYPKEVIKYEHVGLRFEESISAGKGERDMPVPRNFRRL
jgi:hypothetical protein